MIETSTADSRFCGLTTIASIPELIGHGQMGVNTNGAAAKVNNYDGLGKKVRPGTSGEIKVG